MGLSKKAAERVAQIAAMEVFFLKAMREKSWAAGVKGIAVLNTPGLWCNKFKEGDFYLKQCYGIFDVRSKVGSRVSLSDTITISLKREEVWLMTYNALYCERKDLSSLKRALMEAYAYEGAGKFHGGRGLVNYEEEGSHSIYNNSAYGNFTHFGGHDKIVPSGKTAPECSMWGSYSGGFVDVRSR